MSAKVRGALVGWKRAETAHGIVVTLQVVNDVDRFHRGDVDRVEIALNDRQLRSLARDLARAAGDRHLQLTGRVPRWQFWRRKPGRS